MEFGNNKSITISHDIIFLLVLFFTAKYYTSLRFLYSFKTFNSCSDSFSQLRMVYPKKLIYMLVIFNLISTDYLVCIMGLSMTRYNKMAIIMANIYILLFYYILSALSPMVLSDLLAVFHYIL